jgi:flagellar hook assembly protein FlgD
VVEGTIVPHSLEIVEAAILDGDRRLVPIVESTLLASGGAPGDEVASEASEIRETRLYQSYPNPSNPVTTISFSLKDRCPVTLRVFTVSGQVVRTLVSEELGPDVHRVIWDGRDERGTRVSSGIYFYRLETPAVVDQKKLVVLK